MFAIHALQTNSNREKKHNQSRSDHITAYQLVEHTLTSLLENFCEVSEFITRRQHVKSLSCSMTPIRQRACWQSAHGTVDLCKHAAS